MARILKTGTGLQVGRTSQIGSHEARPDEINYSPWEKSPDFLKLSGTEWPVSKAVNCGL